ncbi:MAG TPA: indole-3-glycerol phosphate synthase TrpC [Candidatus Methylacidiphilales bacterium]|nr:indole-3-glycerol phosphate synthase TrpC [Candidatus Methylacidiphilales bacterium]
MNKLAEINASKTEEIKRLEPHAAELRKQALLRNDFRPFHLALSRGNEVAVIAEVKKASPSAGVIAENFDPLSQAREYARGGAHALSVLTDEKYFGGHLSHLKQIREQVDLPLLRKDFIIHELQVYESVVAGADAILLIVASLDEEMLRRLYHQAKGCQLDVLVEVHDLDEMDYALDLGADIIGINNRNLKTFEVDLATTETLAEEIPNHALAVSESGIKTAADVRRLRACGINAVLVGETLMRAKNVPEKLAELLLRT